MAKPVKTFADVRKIKDVKKRNAADQALDKKKGIKEGSKKDIAQDKKDKVFNFQYGKGKKNSK